MNNIDDFLGVAPSFSTNNSYLEQLSFESSPEYVLEFDRKTEVHSYVEIIERSKGSQLYSVKLHTDVSLITKEEQVAFTMSLVYSTFVIVDCDPDDDEYLYNTLHLGVPQHLLDPIRSIVWQVSGASGYPTMLKDDTFNEPLPEEAFPESILYEEENPADEDEIAGGNLMQKFYAMLNDDRLCHSLFDDDHDLIPSEGENADETKPSNNDNGVVNFQSVIDEIGDTEEGNTFLNTFWNALNISGFNSFEQIPAYYLYYCFLTPVAYHYPELENVDKEVWPMLFCLLFGNTAANCTLINGKGSLPELKFSYEDYHEFCVSELDVSDLKDLLYRLMTDALCDVSVMLFNRDEMPNVELELLAGKLISKDDFFKLHNYYPGIGSEEKGAYIEKLYSKIKECDIQAYLYRL